MEENQINNKRNILKMSLLIVGLLVLIGGISYAAYTWTFNGTLTNNISTSSIELKFLESNTEIINITNALPMYDDEGIYEPSFDFAVTSNTTRNVNINYTLTISKLSLDTGYTALQDNQMKVYLTDYDGNVLVQPTLISSLTNYQLYSSSHAHSTSNTIVQTLMTAAQSWTTSTKLQYKFKINISSSET